MAAHGAGYENLSLLFRPAIRTAWFESMDGPERVYSFAKFWWSLMTGT